MDLYKLFDGEKFKIKSNGDYSNSWSFTVCCGFKELTLMNAQNYKKNGHLIIAQAAFSINEMITLRKFIVGISRIILKEEFQYSHSTTIKSILLETKLKKFFNKYKKFLVDELMDYFIGL